MSLGNAAEVSSALALAVAWRYVDAAAVAQSAALCDCVRAMTYRLIHPPR